jgi:hypothetical protein
MDCSLNKENKMGIDGGGSGAMNTGCDCSYAAGLKRKIDQLEKKIEELQQTHNDKDKPVGIIFKSNEYKPRRENTLMGCKNCRKTWHENYLHTTPVRINGPMYIYDVCSECYNVNTQQYKHKTFGHIFCEQLEQAVNKLSNEQLCKLFDNMDDVEPLPTLEKLIMED